ncbi:hypothetical protein ACFL3T_05255 [Patescibacteria group bacterium]
MNIFNPKFREARARCKDWREYRMLQTVNEEEAIAEETDPSMIPVFPEISENCDLVLEWGEEESAG